ncbi:MULTISPECIES: hypothetical protein [Grimontia]|uniref:Uncharacterized protein n=1 Tax=Grimontia marina TaxID=646534 RepID=A0A128FHC8_9GAMM|nr:MULTISPECIES: hypothetical protein [Grimontia]WRV98633.1 hypothetical protein VP504_04115 [Grimontia sp. NTOU-MAR1]CZF86199.1 hypothetical protein GMA8713_04233 [Grimontia marina]
MQRSTLIGLKVGLLALLLFIGMLGMSTNSPATEWLKEAFLGISFAFAFGLGAPEVLAYLLATIVFIAVFCVGYFVGKKASGKLDS